MSRAIQRASHVRFLWTVAFLMCFTGSVRSQDLGFCFLLSAGDAGAQSASAATRHFNGDMIVTGSFEGTIDLGSGPLVAAGGKDIFLARRDANGVPLWSVAFPGTLDEESTALAITNSSNIAMVGFFEGTVDFGGGVLSSSGGTDIFLAIFDPSGSHVFSAAFGDAADQAARGVLVNQTGRIIVTGGFFGTVNFGGGNLTSLGGEDAFIATFTSLGAPEFSNRYGGLGDQRALGIAGDIFNELVIVGEFENSIDFFTPQVSAGGTDIFAARFTSTLFELWSRRFGDAFDETATAVVADSGNDFIVTGSFEGTVDFDGGPLVSSGSRDVFLAKFDAFGFHIWSTRAGDALSQEGLAVAVNSDQEISVVGRMSGIADFGSGPMSALGGSDGFAARYDSAGVSLASIRFGGLGADAAHGVNLDGTVVGNFEQTGSFGSGILSSAGGADLFLGTLCDVVPPTPPLTFCSVFGEGDGLNQVATAVARDLLGDTVVTGTFEGAINLGTIPLNAAGGRDIFLAKRDPSGSTTWSKSFPGSLDEVSTSIAITNGNQIVIAGHFNGTVDFGGGALVSAGGTDVFFAIFDPLGFHVFSSAFGDASDQAARGVFVNQTSRIILTGGFSGTVNFGGGNLTSLGGEDVFIASFTANGAPEFSVRFGGIGDQRALGITGDIFNDFVIVGEFENGIDFDTPLVSAGGTDIFVSRYTDFYFPLWSFGFGDSSNQTATAVVADSNNDLIVTGSFAGSVDFGGGPLASSGGRDVFVAKFDPFVNHLWSRIAGDAQNQDGLDLDVGPADEILVSGGYSGSVDFGTGALTSTGGEDGFIVEYDSTGTAAEALSLGGAGTDVALGITWDGVAVGSFEQTASFRSVDLTSAGGTDLFIASLCRDSLLFTFSAESQSI